MTPKQCFMAWMVFLWALVVPVCVLAAAASSQTPRLWRLAAQEQARLEQRNVILQDASLTGYLQAVVERLWAQVHTDLSTPTAKVIMDTRMEAYAYPNGYCVLSTGILNQMESEGQLAMILAHEMVHYVRQHTVVFYDHFQKPAPESALPYADQGQAAGEPTMIQKINAAEFQADIEGLAILRRAGYCEAEVSTLMSNMIESMRDQGQTGKIKRLKKRISMINTQLRQDHRRPVCPSATDGSRALFLNRIAPALKANAQTALQCGNWNQADRSVTKFLEVKPDDAGAYYLKGEILRRRNTGDGKNQCVQSYLMALKIDPKFPLAHRALGEVYFKAGRYQAAKPYFEAFLSLAPQDHVSEYIKGYLRQCQN